jgi:hypothetical protein
VTLSSSSDAAVNTWIVGIVATLAHNVTVEDPAVAFCLIRLPFAGFRGSSEPLSTERRRNWPS